MRAYHSYKREFMPSGNPRSTIAEITGKTVERLKAAIKSCAYTATGVCVGDIMFHLNARFYPC